MTSPAEHTSASHVELYDCEHDHAAHPNVHTHVHTNVHTSWHTSWHTLIDRAGVVLGTLCAVHCALTPFALVFAPLLGLASLWTFYGEQMLLGGAFLLMLPSLIRLVRERRQIKITQVTENRAKSRLINTSLGLFLAAWVLLLSSMFIHESNERDRDHHDQDLITTEHSLSSTSPSHEPHSSLELILSTLGGLALAVAHGLNLKSRHASLKCCTSPHHSSSTL